MNSSKNLPYLQLKIKKGIKEIIDNISVTETKNFTNKDKIKFFLLFVEIIFCTFI